MIAQQETTPPNLTVSDLELTEDHDELKMCDAYMVDLQSIERIIAGDPAQYTATLRITQARIGKLLNKMLKIPLEPDDHKNLIRHAELRGRLKEQILHFNTLSGIKKQRKSLGQRIKLLTDRREKIQLNKKARNKRGRK